MNPAYGSWYLAKVIPSGQSAASLLYASSNCLISEYAILLTQSCLYSSIPMLPSPSISMVLNIAPIKVFSSYFTVLVKVSQIGDFVPQFCHDFGVCLVFSLIPGSFTFNDGVSYGQAFEVIFVKTAIVVDVIHELNNELDAVFPSVAFCINHFAAFLYCCTTEEIIRRG